MRVLRGRAARDHACVPDDGERGAITTWVAMTSLAMMLFVGIAVDFGGQVVALQHVRSVASEAARTGGQQVDVTRAMRGQGVSVNPAAAQAAALRYLDQAGVGAADRDVHPVGGDRLVVTVEDDYDTKILSMIGVSTLRVTGRAEVRLARTVGGVEQ